MNNLVAEAQKKFPKHKRIYVRVKEDAENPFNSFLLDHIIKLKSEHPEYELYFHDKYMTLKSSTIPNYDPVRILIDDKLWIELLLFFDVIKIKKEKKFKRKW